MTPVKQYAVAAVLRADKVLVARRAQARAFLPGRPELPGGLVEEGETPEACVQRELFEELGIRVRVLECAYTFNFEDKNNDKAVEKVFLAKLAPTSRGT